MYYIFLIDILNIIINKPTTTTKKHKNRNKTLKLRHVDGIESGSLGKLAVIKDLHGDNDLIVIGGSSAKTAMTIQSAASNLSYKLNPHVSISASWLENFRNEEESSSQLTKHRLTMSINSVNNKIAPISHNNSNNKDSNNLKNDLKRQSLKSKSFGDSKWYSFIQHYFDSLCWLILTIKSNFIWIHILYNFCCPNRCLSDVLWTYLYVYFFVNFKDSNCIIKRFIFKLNKKSYINKLKILIY